MAYKSMGNLDEALISYNKAIEIDYNHAHAHNGKGNIYNE